MQPISGKRSNLLALVSAMLRFFGLDFLIVGTLLWQPKTIDTALQAIGLQSQYWPYAIAVAAFFISALIRHALLIKEGLHVGNPSGRSIVANLLILATAGAILLRRIPIQEDKTIATAGAGSGDLVVGALVLWAIANFCAQVIAIGVSALRNDQPTVRPGEGSLQRAGQEHGPRGKDSRAVQSVGWGERS